MPRTLLVLLLLAGAAWAADDEARLKPKAYSGKRLQDRAYQAAAYAPPARPAPVGEPLKPGRGGFWRLFRSGKGAAPDPRLAGAAPAEHAPFVQQKQISVPTMSPDPRAVPEKVPFDETGKRVDDESYQAPDKPAEKNPLLAPRQGIKATE